MTTAAALSLFARRHRTGARFLIGFATALLLLAASALGHLWMPDGLRMGPGVLAVIFAIYLAVFPLYPVVRRRANWARRKNFDVLLISCTALLGLWLGVQGEDASLLTSPRSAHAAVIRSSEKAETPSSAPLRLKGTAHHFGQKVQRGMSLLRLVFPRPARFADDPVIFGTGAKIGLTVLTGVLMIGLMVLLAALSCSLSCSGNAVGGTLVLVLGWAAVITLGTFALVRIFRRGGWRERRAERLSARG